MRLRPLAVTVMAAFVPLSLVGLARLSPAWAAAPATITYSCAAQGQATPADTPVSFTLPQLPTGLSAGDTLSLQGTLALVLPAAATQQSRLELASKIAIASSNFGIVIKVDGATHVLKATSAYGATQPIASATTVTASLSFPDFTIPATATGDVTLLMPTTATTASTVVGAPSNVVFTTLLSQDSVLVPTRDLDCWATSSPTAKAPIIVTFPLTEQASTTPAHRIVIAPAPPKPSVDLAAPPALGAPELQLQTPATAAPQAISHAVAAQASQATQSTPALAAAVVIPPQTTGRGVFIPTWSIALALLLIPGAAVAYAVRTGRRLRRLTASPDTPDTQTSFRTIRLVSNHRQKEPTP